MTPPGSRVYAALRDTEMMRSKWPRYPAGLAAGLLLPDRCGPFTPAKFRRNQGRTPICVGEGVGAVAANYARVELGCDVLWSPLALFTLSKMWAKQDLRRSSEGTYSTAAWAVLQSLGLPSEEDWPLGLDASGVPTSPDWYKPVAVGAFQSMGPHLLPFRIEGAAGARAWLGETGRGFSCIGPVNAAYEALGEGGVWRGLTENDPALGLHCQAAHGYTPEGVLMLSSWGDGDRIVPWRFFDDGTYFDMIGPLHA